MSPRCISDIPSHHASSPARSRIARLLVAVDGALRERISVVVASAQMGGVRGSLEVVSAERLVVVCGQVPLAGVGPRHAVVRRPRRGGRVVVGFACSDMDSLQATDATVVTESGGRRKLPLMTANDFDGVRMLVTGGASGIGHAIASAGDRAAARPWRCSTSSLRARPRVRWRTRPT